MVGMFLLQKKINYLELQLSKKSPTIERYGTIQSIDLKNKTFTLTYKNLFNTEEDNTIYAKIGTYTIIEEQNPILLDGIIIKLSETKEIDFSNLQVGDRVFARFFFEETDDKATASFIKRGLPFFP